MLCCHLGEIWDPISVFCGHTKGHGPKLWLHTQPCPAETLLLGCSCSEKPQQRLCRGTGGFNETLQPLFFFLLFNLLNTLLLRLLSKESKNNTLQNVVENQV